MELARDAHQFYAEMIRRYHNAGYTNRVDAITRRQLNKAANALADLIRRCRRPTRSPVMRDGVDP